MRVLIPGGSGLIGSALARELAEAGHEVILLSRRPEALLALPLGVRAAGWDGKTAEGWGELADGAGAIVNLAGESIGAGRWTAARKERIRSSRVDAGRAVVEAIRSAATKPGVLVQASAVGYYGPCADQEVTEETPAGADFLAGVAREWEASTAAVEALGVRRLVARTGIVLAGEGGALPQIARPFRCFVGGRAGSGRQWMSWIHLADEVAALRFLIEREDLSGPFNLAAPQPVRNADFARALGRALRRPAWAPAPAFALRLLLGEMATLVLDGQRAMPARLQAASFRFRYAVAAEALPNALS